MKKFGLKIAVFSTILSLFSFFTPTTTSAATAWQQVGGNGLGDPENVTVPVMTVWNGYIYAGVGRPDTSGRIYRSANGTTWDLVEDNFGHADLNMVVDLAAFDGYLYAALGSETATPVAGEIWRTADGTTWTQSGAEGLGDANNTEFYHFAEFDSQLYIGSINMGGGQLFRTTDGVTWNNITNDGFGDNGNIIIWGLKSFGGYLWAGTENLAGGQVWRSTTGDTADWIKFSDYATLGQPQFTMINNFFDFDSHLFWTASSATGAIIAKRDSDALILSSVPGLGNIKNIWFSEGTAEVGGQVYIGTRNTTTGGELWALTDGLTGTQIGEDGFGNVDNFALYAVTFNKYLYVGFSSSDDTVGLQIFRRVSSPNFEITNHNLPDGTQGQSYSETVSAEHGKGPYTFAVTDGSLPPGLSLDAATGAITGTPTEAGYFKFTLEATDSRDKTTDKTLSISILGASTTTTTNIEDVTVLPQTGADLS